MYPGVQSEYNISVVRVSEILKEDLLKDYRIQLTQELKQNDRRMVVNWALERLEEYYDCL